MAELSEEPNLRWFDGAGEMVADPEPPAILQQATARSRAASERGQLFILFVAETVGVHSACPFPYQQITFNR